VLYVVLVLAAVVGLFAQLLERSRKHLKLERRANAELIAKLTDVERTLSEVRRRLERTMENLSVTENERLHFLHQRDELLARERRRCSRAAKRGKKN
jgi:hypothetical protein